MALTEAEKNNIVREAHYLEIEIKVNEQESVRYLPGGGAKLEFVQGQPCFVRREYSYTVSVPAPEFRKHSDQSRNPRIIASWRQWEQLKADVAALKRPRESDYIDQDGDDIRETNNYAHGL